MRLHYLGGKVVHVYELNLGMTIMEDLIKLFMQFTTTEFHILELVAKGYSNKEISQTCYFSRNTICSYISQILLKLNVKNRTQAAYILGRFENSKDLFTDNKLTKRENDVTELLILGHTNKTIAKILKISPNTTKAHVTSILQKYSARNRTNLGYIVGKTQSID